MWVKYVQAHALLLKTPVVAVLGVGTYLYEIINYFQDPTIIQNCSKKLV